MAMKQVCWWSLVFLLGIINVSSLITNAKKQYEPSSEELQRYFEHRNQINFKSVYYPFANKYYGSNKNNFERYRRSLQKKVNITVPANVTTAVKHIPNKPTLIKFEVADAIEPSDEVKALLQRYKTNTSTANKGNVIRVKRSSRSKEPNNFQVKFIPFEVTDAREPNEQTKELIKRMRSLELERLINNKKVKATIESSSLPKFTTTTTTTLPPLSPTEHTFSIVAEEIHTTEKPERTERTTTKRYRKFAKNSKNSKNSKSKRVRRSTENQMIKFEIADAISHPPNLMVNSSKGDNLMDSMEAPSFTNYHKSKHSASYKQHYLKHKGQPMKMKMKIKKSLSSTSITPQQFENIILQMTSNPAVYDLKNLEKYQEDNPANLNYYMGKDNQLEYIQPQLEKEAILLHYQPQLQYYVYQPSSGNTAATVNPPEKNNYEAGLLKMEQEHTSISSSGGNMKSSNPKQQYTTQITAVETAEPTGNTVVNEGNELKAANINHYPTIPSYYMNTQETPYSNFVYHVPHKIATATNQLHNPVQQLSRYKDYPYIQYEIQEPHAAPVVAAEPEQTDDKIVKPIIPVEEISTYSGQPIIGLSKSQQYVPIRTIETNVSASHNNEANSPNSEKMELYQYTTAHHKTPNSLGLIQNPADYHIHTEHLNKLKHSKEIGDLHTKIYYKVPKKLQQQQQHKQIEQQPALVELPKQYASLYGFGYRVRDAKTGNDFGHKQNRDVDGITRGQYHILLPDGRIQNVIYHAGKAGFHADVTFQTTNLDK